MVKDNINQAFKLYTRTILAGVMGFIIYLSVSVIFVAMSGGGEVSASTLLIRDVISLLIQGILFYVIVYTKLWELGDKNQNAVAFGHMAAGPLRGLKIGLLASIPSIVSFLALVADKLFGLWSGMATAYRICQLALYPIVSLSMGTAVTVTTTDISWGGILCAGLPVLFVPAVATLGYYLGYRHILVWEKIVFVNKKK